MDFNTVKALHIIFVVSWFAGLFYIVRLFIYHVEAQEKEEPAKSILSEQFKVMQKRLWWIITTPAMVLSLLFGIWMLTLNWEYYAIAKWMHVKLSFVLLLLVYHFICQSIMIRMAKGRFKWKSNALRMWNELATLCLVAIAFLVSYKSALNWWKGVVGFFGVAVLLMLLIKLYKRIRSKSENNVQ